MQNTISHPPTTSGDFRDKMMVFKHSPLPHTSDEPPLAFRVNLLRKAALGVYDRCLAQFGSDDVRTREAGDTYNCAVQLGIQLERGGAR